MFVYSIQVSYHEVCLGFQLPGKRQQVHHSDSFVHLKYKLSKDDEAEL